MKILVGSDTHHSIGDLYDAIELEKPDAVIHLGDHLSDAEDLAAAFDRIPFYCVPGNCDYAPFAEDTKLLELGGVRLLLAHGHQFGVMQGLERLRQQALRMGAQAALFGHTHVPLCDVQSGLWLLNPGTCRGYPRSTYGLVTVRNGEILCRICELPK